MFKANFLCLFLVLVLTFSFLPACSESPPGNSQTTKPAESSPGQNSNITDPPGNGDIVEPRFYVGLPGEREDRFSLAYARSEDLSLNPFLYEEDENVFQACDFLYEKLLRYNKSEARYESGILESISFDDRQLILHVKGELSFHNGFNLQANDIMQTFMLFQTSGHRLGRLLDDAVISYLLDDNFTVRISLSDQEDAVLNLFKCMERIPILPFQLWDAVLTAGSDLATLQEIHPFPAVGSGPYRLLRQDDFTLILEKYTQGPDSSFYNDYPSYLVYYKYQRDELALAALAHGDLDALLRSSDLHPLKYMSDILSSFANLSFWEDESAGSFFPLPVQEQRMGIALNPASDRLGKLASRKFVQSILLSLIGTQQSLYPNVTGMVSLPAANQLTLPSILPQDLTRTDALLLPNTSPQSIIGYLDDLRWQRDPQSGLIVDENGLLVELNFYYPDISADLTSVCRQMVDIANDYGLAVIGREVAVEDWQDRLENHDYDLIYMESDPDESIPQMLSRVQVWPGLEPDSDLKDSNDFAAESGRNLLQQCRTDALAFNSISSNLEKLNTFMIENYLFVPLGIALKSGGVGSEVYFSSDLNEQLQDH